MNDERASFIEGGGAYHVRGPLVFDTVLDVLPMSTGWAEGTGALVIDLAGVDRTDSAGLALLVEWLRAAQSARRPLSFAHVPPALHTLIEVSDLAGVIPLAA